MRSFVTKLAGAFASFVLAFALVASSAQEVKAQSAYIIPAPPGCCFDVFVNIPVADAGVWRRVEITRTAGPAPINVVGLGGVTNSIPAPAGLHYFLASNPAPFLPTGLGTLVGRVCVAAGVNTTITLHLQRQVAGVWVNGVNLTYVVNCGPNGPYVINVIDKENGYENENSFGFSGSGMTAAPNPASGQTMLRFETIEALSGSVLSISDVTGREVLRLLDGATLSAGAHEIPVNTEALNNGIYMVNLRSENGTIISTKFSVLH